MRIFKERRYMISFFISCLAVHIFYEFIYYPIDYVSSIGDFAVSYKIGTFIRLFFIALSSNVSILLLANFLILIMAKNSSDDNYGLHNVLIKIFVIILVLLAFIQTVDLLSYTGIMIIQKSYSNLTFDIVFSYIEKAALTILYILATIEAKPEQTLGVRIFSKK